MQSSMLVNYFSSLFATLFYSTWLHQPYDMTGKRFLQKYDLMAQDNLTTNKLANKSKLKLIMINQSPPTQNNKPVKAPHIRAVWNTALGVGSRGKYSTQLSFVLYFVLNLTPYVVFSVKHSWLCFNYISFIVFCVGKIKEKIALYFPC